MGCTVPHGSEVVKNSSASWRQVFDLDQAINFLLQVSTGRISFLAYEFNQCVDSNSG